MKFFAPSIVCFAVIALLASPRFVRAETKQAVKYYGAFAETRPTEIEPQGWMKEMLHRQAQGMGKHHAVSGYPYDTCLWAGQIPPSPNPKAKTWWPYEQAGYLVDGLERLGLMTGDAQIIGEAEANVKYIVTHPRADGSLGPGDIGAINWPHAVVFRALMASYAAHPDAAIPEAVRSHYLLRPADFGVARDVCNVEGMLWAYAQTGDPRLLEIAKRTYDNFNRPDPKTSLSALAGDQKIVEHGVTFNETAKVPVLLYMYNGDASLLAAAVNAYRKIDRDHMLAGGVHSCQEFLSGKDPWTLIETCDVTDYTWSLGYLLMATGDATWADHIEKAVFNAGIGAVAKDFKSHQYFSAANQVIATHGICKAHNPDRQAYRPGHDVECCSGNVHRFLPNYAMRQWLVQPAGGVVAAMYGPSKLSTSINGVAVRIDQQTDYPFSDQIKLVIHAEKPIEFPLSLRIPGWTTQPTLAINGKRYADLTAPGSFTTVRRMFKDGDELILHLPMTTRIVEWPKQTVSIERGPLAYSLKIEESAEKVIGEKSSAELPAWNKRPASPWAYALALKATDSTDAVKVVSKPITGCPWDTNNTPIELQLAARPIKNWGLTAAGGNPGFPSAPQYGDGSVTVTLVPYGSTCLRLTVFPQVRGDSN